MTKPIELITINQNGWWTAICKDLGISGFGETEQDAVAAFRLSMISTISTRLHLALELEQENVADAEPTLFQEEKPRIARRIQLNDAGQLVAV